MELLRGEKMNRVDNRYKIKANNETDKLNDNVYLFLGDCLEQLKNIEDESVDCIITDPPYFLDGMGSGWNTKELFDKTSKSKVIGSLPVGMKYDKQQGYDLQAFMSKVSEEAFRVLKKGGFFISFSQGRLYHRMAVAIEDSGFEIRDMLVWKREGQAKAFSQNHFVKKMNISDKEKQRIIEDLDGRKTPQLKGQSEPIVLAQKPKDTTFINTWLENGVGLIDTTISLDGKFPGTVMEVPKPNKDERCVKHLTVKPVKLMEHLVQVFSAPNAVILDPFLGSGTTGVACINTNRQFIGIELDTDFYKASKNRLKKTISGVMSDGN